jgi:hypothetical protein
MDGGAFFPVESGFVIPCGVASGFTKLTFQNNSANAITIVVYAGISGVNYLNSGAAKDQSSYAYGNFSGALAAAAVQQVPGNHNGNQRKQIVVTNWDNNNTLSILDANGNVLGLVAPLSVWTLPTDAYLQVKATNGAIGQCVIGEIYYTA